jgi:hypothetical protein
MANHTTYTRDTGWKAPLTAQGLARRQGWNDAIDGAPPDRRLMDHADKHVAMSYERGRLFALNVIASGQKPLRWRTTTSTPSTLGNQLARANALVGRATPSI